MISNCGHDENGKYHDGKAGDQTGGEWSIIKWYNRPWLGIFRHPDQKVRDCMVKLATDAANNNNVGYDQYQRTTYWTELKANNYDASKIKKPCEADCSSGVAANAKAAGYILGDAKLQAIPETMYTGNQKSILKKAGFEYLDDPKYINSDEYLLPGDILYYNKSTKTGTSGHTVTNLTLGKKVTLPKTEPAPVKEVKDETPVDKSFMVSITTPHLRIRKGPGTNYAMLYTSSGAEKWMNNKITHKITETKSGEGSKAGWGKLASGEGWIALDWTKKV